MKDKNKQYGFLFDLDGVLIDSEREYSKIWAKVNEEYPTGVVSLETKIKGCTLDKILEDHYPDLKMREKVVTRLYQLEREMRYNYLPGAEKMLGELNKKSIPAVMVTSSNDVKMKHLDEELPDIRNYFTQIVTADRITKSKPDPEGYLTGAALIGVPIERCVVFEDSLQGVMAGKRSGAYVVGIAGTLPREVISPYCDMVIDSLDEIDVETIIRKIDGDD